MKILIVDDQPSNLVLLRYFLEQDGHECIEAINGEQAIAAFEQYAPDFVLLDVVMPVMDGYQAAEEIKRLSQGHHVPIIFLTAQTEQASLLQCLENGDDYLLKPVNEIMLKAKITAHTRTQELTEQISANNAELTRLHETLQQEHEMGQHVLNHALQRTWANCPNVRSYLSSISSFNGDLCLVSPSPKGGIYAFLGDMTGHGLAAAIGTVPVSQVFFTMAKKAKSLRDMATELNLALSAFLPAHMFCAAAILELNQQGDTLTIWSGGLPEAYIVRPTQGVVASIQSQHLPLGILPKDDFDHATQSYILEPEDRLLLLTDGVLEAQSELGGMFGEQRLLAAIGSGQEGYFEQTLQALERYTEGVGQLDDVSLVEIVSRPLELQALPATERSQSLAWELNFQFDTAMLKVLDDPLGAILNVLPGDASVSLRLDAVQVILAELFSNALEHGVLGLDSAMKSNAEGFAEFYHLRRQRLEQLSTGEIQVSLALVPGTEVDVLKLKVSDSGSGFDYNELSSELTTRPWGRGLAMVEALSQSIRFSENGACIEVSLAL